MVLSFTPATERLEAERNGGFDALLAEVQQSAEGAEQLSSARKWLGEQFYSGSDATLTSLRLALGLSQTQLGERCGLEQPHISRYESGKIAPGIDIAARLAAALGVSLDEFYQAWSNTSQVAKG